MLQLRPIHGLAAILGLIFACVSDTGNVSQPKGDAGVAADTGASSTSSSSSSSSSGGEDAKPDAPPIAPLFGCTLANPGSAILHLDQANAIVDAQQRVTGWPNLVDNQQVGAATGTIGEIIRDTRAGVPSIKFDNRRAAGGPMPDRRIAFSGMKTLSGSFALFVYGGHDFDNGMTEFDASSVGATYLHSSSGTNRLQLMGQYHRSENSFDAFGALFFPGTQQDLSDRVGVYKDFDVLGGNHFFEVYDRRISATSEAKASLFVDEVVQPTTQHLLATGAATGSTVFIGGSDRTDQMLAGGISELVLLKDPSDQEIKCVRDAMRRKYP